MRRHFAIIGITLSLIIADMPPHYATGQLSYGLQLLRHAHIVASISPCISAAASRIDLITLVFARYACRGLRHYIDIDSAIDTIIIFTLILLRPHYGH